MTDAAQRPVRILDGRQPLPVRLVLLVVGWLRTLFRHLFADQARNGRLRRIEWPNGLRPLVHVAVAAYFVAVALIVGSGFLRDRLPLVALPGGRTLALPGGPLWLILFLVVLSVALMQCAALHSAAWLRVAGTAFSILCIGYVCTFVAGQDERSTELRVLGGCVAAGLIVLTAVRWRRTFAWWEFPIVLGLMVSGIVVPLSIANETTTDLGFDLLPLALSLVFQVIGQLAVPLSVAAGVSAAELAMGAATRTAEFVREQLPARVLGAIFALVTAWRAWSAARSLTGERADDVARVVRQHVAAACLVAIVFGGWYVLGRWADRAGAKGSTELFHLMVLKARVALPASAALTLIIVPVVVLLLTGRTLLTLSPGSGPGRWMSDLADDIGSESSVRLYRYAAGVLLIAAGFFLARRGHRGLAESSALIGVVVVALYATDPDGPLSSWAWSTRSLEHVGLSMIVAAAVWWGLTRRLTTRRVTALIALVLLAALLPDSDFVSDPIAALLGFAGVGFVLFGFIWRLLSDSGPANEGSRRFPREVRVLLLLAYNLFGVTVLAFSALARDPGVGIDLGALAVLGAEFLGTAILLGAFVSVAFSALGDRPLLEEMPPAIDAPSFDDVPRDPSESELPAFT